jgi:predicted permease
MSINISMVYPFAALSLGAAAFSQLVMFDMGHALIVWTVTTVVACKYGGHADDIPVLLKRTLAAPPLLAMILALALNACAAPIPHELLRGALFTGQMLILLVPLAMGLLVSARGMRRPEVIAAVALRSGFGALLGVTLAWLFHLTGTAAAIAIIGAAAPIGFTSVVLSAREGLDLDLAASAAAISVFLGSLWIPLAMVFVPR